MKKNVDKFYLSRSVGHNGQSITRFDSRAAVSLPNDAQEWLWIQESTGKAWIGLEQNIIVTDVNELRKRFHASVRIMGRHFDQCGQLKMHN